MYGGGRAGNWGVGGKRGQGKRRNCERQEDLKFSDLFVWGILTSATKKGNLNKEREFLLL